MKRLIALSLIVSLFTSGCATDQVLERSERAISDQGYTNIQYEGYAWFECGKEDTFALKYTATAPATGRQVTLAACSGVFKGVTVRTIN